MDHVSLQAEVAEELVVASRRLAQSTLSVPYPPDSYALLAALGSTAASLAQSSKQLAHWHDEAVSGVEYLGEDENGDGKGATVAAQKLRQAAVALERAAEKLAAAQSSNNLVRWNLQREL